MKKQTIILISILIVLLVACTNRSNYHQILIQANSLMTAMPDSALHILQNIIPQQLPTQADKAYYALLFTQAQDKNFILQTKDSLIRTAVQYYDSIKDERMQAKAYYYWGCIYRDSNKQSAAIEKYLTAISLALKINDEPLLGRIYNSMGYLYYLQGLYDRADSIYLKTEQIGIQLKDTSLWAESLLRQGNIKLNQQLYSQAEKNLQQAIHILGDVKQNRMQSTIAATLSSLYGKTGDGAKAIQYAKQTIKFQKDTTHCYRAFLLLGDAYFKMGQYDSANIYINKVLLSPSYADKASAYMRLADIAQIRGEIAQSLEMEKLYSAYKDSLSKTSQRDKVIETEKQVLIKQQKIQYEHFLSQYRYYIFLLIIISILLLYILQRRYQQRIHRQNQERIQSEKVLNQQYSLLKEELKQKEGQIANLQNEITQNLTNEEHRRVLHKELVEMNKQRVALAREALEHLDVYAKVQRIINDYKVKDYSKESLSKEEWLKLIAEIDKDGIITQLGIRYNLSENEVHLCCLSLMNLSLIDKARAMHYKRTTIYRKEKDILEKMGENYQAGKLEVLLKKYIKEAVFSE
ncbi:hypothetical protein AAE250_07600 [Bacteroides sp. GD17]|mgnify:CR=1 FL=1|uniref:tetratricopeptide repeat protein n=1 Tax=Bacteroides sp. GD17 TaxID=3139826 RepID=UPI00313CDD5E